MKPKTFTCKVCGATGVTRKDYSNGRDYHLAFYGQADVNDHMTNKHPAEWKARHDKAQNTRVYNKLQAEDLEKRQREAAEAASRPYLILNYDKRPVLATDLSRLGWRPRGEALSISEYDLERVRFISPEALAEHDEILREIEISTHKLNRLLLAAFADGEPVTAEDVAKAYAAADAIKD